MRTILRKILAMLVVLGLLAAAGQPAFQALAAADLQTADPLQKARALLIRMTPEERVGQLFVASFKGRDINSKESKILDLVTNRHLGGVILKASNDNFTGPTGTVDDTLRLTTELQSAKWNFSLKPYSNPVSKQQYTPQFIPLFVGVTQDGDSSPTDQIFYGVTALPSEMAIGATWSPKLAERTGSALGTDLLGMGINLLFGPSLDVNETARRDSGDDLGNRVFGGSPFWVGELGKAYIRGVHQGSAKKVAVIAKNFPGRGNSDRPPEEEAASVKKTIDQIKAVELDPFLEVANAAPQGEATADGFLVSHIRYQAFQGSIRPSTRPISFDQAALDQILAISPLSLWRQGGGILVSENLGSPSIKKFYDPTNTSFDARQIARNAFLAGNDILLVDNFIGSGDPDPTTTLQRTLEFFAQKYREDQAFAQRVDASVTRILTLKFRMYTDFNLTTVVPTAAMQSQVGQLQQVAFDVARQGVTLLSPSTAELAQTLPKPPGLSDRIIFFIDNATIRQCSQCSPTALLAVDAMQSAVNRLYGPRAGGQVLIANMFSYSLADLKLELDLNKDRPVKLEEDLKLATWVVLAVTQLQPGRIETQTIKRLLTDRPDLLQNKKIIMFAFGAPYYLDATDITKLSAFYSLYSKIPAFVEVAARILFQELTPSGFSPVSVTGAGYELSMALSPDPAQVIILEVDTIQPVVTPTPQTTLTARPTQSATPTAAPKFKVGDMLPLRTGVILDRNKNPVPDGTPVRFLFTLGSGDSSTQSQLESLTTQGIARASFRIPGPGLLELRVVSEPALSSRLLRLEVTSTGAVAITAITPTPLPSATPTVTVTSTVTQTVTVTATPTPVPVFRPATTDWSLSLLLVFGLSGLAFLIGRKRANLRWAIRWALLVAAGGWLGYLYLTLKLPGAEDLLSTSGRPVIYLGIVVGALIGLITGEIWRNRMSQRARQGRPPRTSGST